ncbi:MAG: hypothetical protein KGZ75_13405 [Syntrophomonadaceae bacterium]|nr:hypothetical protein [Syntrophomonadaceae bacterium]
MKKQKVIRVRVNGSLDALTDMLKYYLYQQPGQTADNLVARVLGRLVTNQTAAKLEKHVSRCLHKNPAFEQTSNNRWLLDARGQRGNDQLYQWLQTAGQAMNITEFRLKAKERGIDPELIQEKELVTDSRFLRLKNGKWALIHWEIIRQASAKELDKAIEQMRTTRQPMGVEEIARNILGHGAEGTDLLACLQKDPRFVWVGGHHWYLREALPTPADSGSVRAFALEPFRKAEITALGEAELMLILNDTDPNCREYILSSVDLERGSLRITKRMDRLFAGLPPVAWISFNTQTGPLEAWYLRMGGSILGFAHWFLQNGLEPGSKLRLKRVMGEERVFNIEITGEREAEVFTEGSRVRKLEDLWRKAQTENFALEQLLLEVMELFPAGLPQEEVAQLMAAFKTVSPEEIGRFMETTPYFERTSSGNWRFNQAIFETYHKLTRELSFIKDEISRSQQEIAATLQENQQLIMEKEGLYGELIYLKNHHRDQESQLQEKIRRLKDHLEELQREHAKARAELEKQLKQRETLQQELEKSKQQLQVLRADRDSLKIKTEQLESRILQLQGNLSRSREEIEEQHLRVNQRLKELEAKLHNSVISNDDLERTVVKLQEERRLLKRRMNHWLVRWAIALTSGWRQNGNNFLKS